MRENILKLTLLAGLLSVLRGLFALLNALSVEKQSHRGLKRGSKLTRGELRRQGRNALLTGCFLLVISVLLFLLP